jgi:hypothetical protein
MSARLTRREFVGRAADREGPPMYVSEHADDSSTQCAAFCVSQHVGE